jgi:hypothetical protein
MSSATIMATPVDDTAVESSESVVLNLLAGSGYVSGATTSATGSIADNDAPAVILLAGTDVQGAEQGSDVIVFTLNRTVNPYKQLVVNLVWNSTATFGTDYTVTVTGGTLSQNGQQLTLTAGAASATLTVTPVNDTAVELTENVKLTLAAGTGYTLGTPATQTGSILDNDSPTVSVANVSTTEGNTGTKTVAVTVTLSAPKSTPVTVAYATGGGTATAGTDYVSASGTVSFAPGVTSQTINITIRGDRAKEANETFQVTLSNPIGATIGTGTATITILDDEKALLAAEPAAGSASVQDLTASQLDAIVAQAKAYWIGLDPAANLSGVSFSIAEMDGLILGLAAENEITLDATAAGYGWFIDPAASSPAAGSMDLLTVVTHELGHVLGLDHDDAPASSVMSETLEDGVRPLTHAGSHFIDWRWDDPAPQNISVDWDASFSYDSDDNEWKRLSSLLRVKQAKSLVAKAGRWMFSMFS